MEQVDRNNLIQGQTYRITGGPLDIDEEAVFDRYNDNLPGGRLAVFTNGRQYNLNSFNFSLPRGPGAAAGRKRKTRKSKSKKSKSRKSIKRRHV